MTQQQLTQLTKWLANNVFRNEDIMYSPYVDDVCCTTVKIGENEYELTDIIASLHNLLCEAVAGKRYNYMFHWANKIGSWCEDDIFDEILKGEGNESK